MNSDQAADIMLEASNIDGNVTITTSDSVPHLPTLLNYVNNMNVNGMNKTADYEKIDEYLRPLTQMSIRAVLPELASILDDLSETVLINRYGFCRVLANLESLSIRFKDHPRLSECLAIWPLPGRSCLAVFTKLAKYFDYLFYHISICVFGLKIYPSLCIRRRTPFEYPSPDFILDAPDRNPHHQKEECWGEWWLWHPPLSSYLFDLNGKVHKPNYFKKIFNFKYYAAKLLQSAQTLEGFTNPAILCDGRGNTIGNRIECRSYVIFSASTTNVSFRKMSGFYSEFDLFFKSLHNIKIESGLLEGEGSIFSEPVSSAESVDRDIIAKNSCVLITAFREMVHQEPSTVAALFFDSLNLTGNQRSFADVIKHLTHPLEAIRRAALTDIYTRLLHMKNVDTSLACQLLQSLSTEMQNFNTVHVNSSEDLLVIFRSFFMGNKVTEDLILSFIKHDHHRVRKMAYSMLGYTTIVLPEVITWVKEAIINGNPESTSGASLILLTVWRNLSVEEKLMFKAIVLIILCNKTFSLRQFILASFVGDALYIYSFCDVLFSVAQIALLGASYSVEPKLWRAIHHYVSFYYKTKKNASCIPVTIEVMAANDDAKIYQLACWRSQVTYRISLSYFQIDTLFSLTDSENFLLRQSSIAVLIYAFSCESRDFTAAQKLACCRFIISVGRKFSDLTGAANGKRFLEAVEDTTAPIGTLSVYCKRLLRPWAFKSVLFLSRYLLDLVELLLDQRVHLCIFVPWRKKKQYIVATPVWLFIALYGDMWTTNTRKTWDANRITLISNVQKAFLGDSFALRHVGKYYECGIGVNKNMAKAVQLYRLSADQGDLCALGMCYARGSGVEKDDDAAARFYRLSADQGDAVAQYNLGRCYGDGTGVETDLVEAVRFFRLSADQGHADAQNGLGHCYENGTGIEKDLVEAVRFYRLSADQGHAAAQYNLGVFYEYGTGVEKDLVEAVRFFRLSADQGDADAQYSLGDCYKNGTGVEKDLVEAVRFFRLSADQGHADAQIGLDLLL